MALVACKSSDAPEQRPPLPATATSRAPAPSAAPSAAPQPSADASTDVEARRAQPLMWRVHKGTATGHLFGTMHLGVDARRSLPPVVWRALEAATTFVMEADPGAVDPLAMARRSMLPPGESLAKQLGAASYQALVGRVGQSFMGLPIERFRPWFVVVAMTQKMLPPTPPMDTALHAEAQAQKKKLAYLETVDEQLDLLDKAVTAEVLADMVKEYDKAKGLVDAMLRAYRQGDVAALERAVFDPADMKKHGKMYELTFYQRNRAWVPKIERDLAGAFIAVGGGHLLGDKGLVALLAARGYRVERVAAAP